MTPCRALQPPIEVPIASNAPISMAPQYSNSFKHCNRAGNASELITYRRAPATCGELMQGAIDGRDFLVNCPIDVFSKASAFPSKKTGLTVRDTEQYRKVANALEILDGYIESRQVAESRPVAENQCTKLFEGGQELVINSRIPRGKGMASSSADLAAALGVACEIKGAAVSPLELSRLIALVEPSDSVHLPGIAHVNHLDGSVNACLPAPSDLSVLVVDCGGELSTLDFDRERAHSIYQGKQSQMISTLKLMTNSLRLNDPVGIAMAATISARLSQKILPKAPFEELLKSTLEIGALGVNCAHSGTVLGVMFRTSNDLGGALIERIQRQFGSDLEVIGCHQVVAGGNRVY